MPTCFLCIVKPPSPTLSDDNDDDTQPPQQSSNFDDTVLLQSVLFDDQHNKFVPAHIQAQTQQLNQFMQYCKRCKKRLNSIRTQDEQLRELQEALDKQKRKVRRRFLKAVSQNSAAVHEQYDAIELDNNAELAKLQQLRESIVTAVTGTGTELELSGEKTSTSTVTVPLFSGGPIRLRGKTTCAGTDGAAAAAEAAVQGHVGIRSRPDHVNVKIKIEANAPSSAPEVQDEESESDDGSCEFVGAVWKSFEEIDDPVVAKLRSRRRDQGQRPLDGDGGDDAGINWKIDRIGRSTDAEADLEPRKKRRKITESETTNVVSGSAGTGTGSDEDIRTGTGSDKDIRTGTGNDKDIRTGSDNGNGKTPTQSGSDTATAARTDTGEKKRFLCLICSKEFRYADKMQKHVSLAHADSDLPPFGCFFCPMRFATRRFCNFHTLQVHEGEEPFECQVCGQRFAWRRSLFLHLNTYGDHRSNFPFSCCTCSKRFRQMSELSHHETYETSCQSGNYPRAPLF